jgi:hypothetical protein
VRECRAKIKCAHPPFEICNFVVCKGVRLCDDRYEVYLLMETTHELDVYLFEAVKTIEFEHEGREGETDE